MYLNELIWGFVRLEFMCHTVSAMDEEKNIITTESRRGGVSTKLASLVTVVVALVAFSGGWALSGERERISPLLPAFVGGALVSDQPPAGVDFSPVWRAWRLIDERFVAVGTSTAATSTPEERIWGMIEGMTASMGDPYTVFMPPVEAGEFQEDISGVFEGVGMEVDVRNGILTVVSPLKDSPAAKAGIQPKDQILKIDGVSTAGIDVGSAVKKIRGPRGSSVELIVLHDGAKAPITISIVRDVINFPTIETEQRDDGIFVISLYSFTAPSPTLFRNALREFVESGSTKLILDLRGNPGGYLEAAVDMASWFLPSGKVVVTEDYGTKQAPTVYRSRGYDVFNDNMKLVILVDQGSASASEILAGALKEYGTATLIGMRTFGKGSVQELVKITPETALKVTVARWLLPGDVWIPATGIEPDIAVERTLDDVKADKDPQMDRAVEFLKSGK